MTLNLVVANHWHVVQVSDRRLTLNGEPWDDHANKCIVLLCRDALLSLTYTGLAYIGDVPTDQWIADILDRYNTPERDMGWSVGILRSAASRAFQEGMVPPAEIENELTIMAAGWHWRAGRPQAYIWEVTKGSSTKVKPCFKSQYWRLRRFAKPGEALVIAAAGAVGALEGTTWNADVHRVKAERNPERIVEYLVNVVREASKHPVFGRLIGDNCMAVVLPKEKGGEIYSEYLAQNGSPLGYTPRMVSPGSVIGDCEMFGSEWTLDFQGWRFRLRGSQCEVPGGIVAGMFSRPPRPRPG